MAEQFPMPIDWDNHSGWDAYYQWFYESGEYVEKFYLQFELLEASSFLPIAQSNKPTKKVWVAGCGASILPHLLAAAGCQVWATDASAKAIYIQKELQKRSFDSYLSEESLAKLSEFDLTLKGALHLSVHDFRQPFQTDAFHYILNIKAFQGLPLVSMKATAKSHFAALTNTGIATFSTMNVQGERRDWIEDSLVEAGFLVPFYETNRWYRRVLTETDIPHVFILNRPMVFRGDPRYRGNEAKATEDQETLRGFDSERRQRTESERSKTQAFLDTASDFKIAQIIYNTG